jgi:hypothetical protein
MLQERSPGPLKKPAGQDLQTAEARESCRRAMFGEKKSTTADDPD